MTSVAMTPPLQLASKISTKEKKISFFGIVEGIPGFILIFLDTELNSIINVDEGNMYGEFIINR